MLNAMDGEKGFLFSEKGIQYLKAYLSQQKGLSRRETEVVVLVLQGLTNKQVADKLCVAEKTVKFHLTNIYKRMEISRRSQIVWKLPLSDFMQKFKESSAINDRVIAESIHSPPETAEDEISIPTGRSTVSDIVGE